MKTFLKIAGCLLLVYATSYVVNVKRFVGFGMDLEGHCWAFTSPDYRLGGRAAQWFYEPAYWIDQQIRTRFWADTSESDAGPASPGNYEVP